METEWKQMGPVVVVVIATVVLVNEAQNENYSVAVARQRYHSWCTVLD